MAEQALTGHAQRLLDEADGRDALERVEGELAAIARMLNTQVRLRKALSDPDLPAANKKALLDDLAGGTLDAATVELLATAAEQRRVPMREFPELVAGLAAQAAFTAAEADGELERLEEELYQLGTLVDREPGVRSALTDPGLPVDHKQALVADLLHGHAGERIAFVEGMPSAMANELLEFPSGLVGMALNLDFREIGCIVFGDSSGIPEGGEVRHTGRVIDPLGRPLDGKGEIEAETTRTLELQAPSVVERQPVKEPLETGIKAIDSMTNIGRGQRELIIGDQKTGKTAVCLDAIVNQRQHWGTERQVKCIYVAIGQKDSTVREFVGALEEHGALGQHWMYKGEHALIVFDDLSKQAEAYREISLLLRRPAGREAYPGDVFYLHSRLLERCAKLSDDLGGGSLTGLPIIETKGNDVSAYIPTNVIS